MVEFGYFVLGLFIGIIAASIAWFFIAKNNKGRLLKAFAQVTNLPQEVKDILKKYGYA